MGRLIVHNVAAMVLPAGIVPENLLGLSFLRRLRRFEYAGRQVGAGTVANTLRNHSQR
jgi:aspartyl protease family protein